MGWHYELNSSLNEQLKQWSMRTNNVNYVIYMYQPGPVNVVSLISVTVERQMTRTSKPCWRWFLVNGHKLDMQNSPTYPEFLWASPRAQLLLQLWQLPLWSYGPQILKSHSRAAEGLSLFHPQLTANERGRVLRAEQHSRLAASYCQECHQRSHWKNVIFCLTNCHLFALALRVNWIIAGFLSSSTAMSLMVIWEEESNAEKARTMSSLEWKKPKKQQQHTAQSIM